MFRSQPRFVEGDAVVGEGGGGWSWSWWWCFCRQPLPFSAFLSSLLVQKSKDLVRSFAVFVVDDTNTNNDDDDDDDDDDDAFVHPSIRPSPLCRVVLGAIVSVTRSAR